MLAHCAVSLRPGIPYPQQRDVMEQAHQSDINRALRIVGAEDFFDAGEEGMLTIAGGGSQAVISEFPIAPGSPLRATMEGEPVQISRTGGLEISCPGFYAEGRSVRNVVHRAARALSAATPL